MNPAAPPSALEGMESLEPPVKRYRGGAGVVTVSSQGLLPGPPPPPPINPISTYVSPLNNNNPNSNNNNNASLQLPVQPQLAYLTGQTTSGMVEASLKGLAGHDGVQTEKEPSRSPGAASSGSAGAMEGAAEAGDVKTLFVSGLPFDTKHRELYLLFRSYPGYSSCLLKGPSSMKPGATLNRKQSSPIAFVTFSTRAQAERAKQELQGVRFDPDLPTTLRLEFARSNTKASTTFNKLKRQHSPQPPLAAALQQVQQQVAGLASQQQNVGAPQPVGGGAQLVAPHTSYLPHHNPFTSPNQIHPAVLRIAQMQQVLQLVPGMGGYPVQAPPAVSLAGQIPAQPLHAGAPVSVPGQQQRRTDPWAAAGQPHPAALAAAAAAAAAGFPII